MAIKTKIIVLLGIIALALLAFLGYRAFDATRSHLTALAPAVKTPGEAVATFAGGCFWCTEADFEKLPGVLSAISGYTGGSLANPSYAQVSHEDTGHREAVEVHYDPSSVSYDGLLNHFFQHIDPTDADGQFVDQGPSYRAGIFYRTEGEHEKAEAAKATLAKSDVFGTKQIVTEILPAGPFYQAEEYHQDYYLKNPLRYSYYRGGSGRNEFLAKYWTSEAKAAYAALRPNTERTRSARPTSDELRRRLAPLQYAVTQEGATEPAFDNEYWNEERDGIYVDVVSGEPLFSSLDKYDSGTGWPSFTKPLVSENITLKTDYFLIFPRTEVRSTQADSHLGHLFKDGPAETGGLRYCMNSAALRFIPKERLEEEGYGAFAKLF